MTMTDVRYLQPGQVFVSRDFNSLDEPLRYRVTGQPRGLPIRGLTMVPAVPVAHLTDDASWDMPFELAEKVEVDQ